MGSQDNPQDPIHAGYVQAKKWDVSLRRGRREPHIGFDADERIQYPLEEGGRPDARKSFDPDFPMRGFVMCSECGNAMTGAWSNGCRKHYAYYRCETRGCSQKSKSIPKSRIEGGFEEILKGLRPTKKLFGLVCSMISDA